MKRKILNSKFYILNSLGGFTLVELLVSLGVFIVITAIAIGGFARALSTQRQVVALIAAGSNMSLMMEQISRELRTGYNFCSAASPCSTPDVLTLTNFRGDSVVYSLGVVASSGVILRAVNGDPADQITADNVNIRYLSFSLLNDVNFPPRVKILIGFSPAKGKAVGVDETISRIQTTVSARVF